MADVRIHWSILISERHMFPKTTDSIQKILTKPQIPLHSLLEPLPMRPTTSRVREHCAELYVVVRWWLVPGGVDSSITLAGREFVVVVECRCLKHCRVIDSQIRDSNRGQL